MVVAQVTAQPSLRERKAAKTRLAIVESLHRRLLTEELADIGADELANDANISRMTFFNYFPSKRDAVDLLLVVHTYRMLVELRRSGTRGVDAIETLFSIMADAVIEAPHRMRRIYALHLGRPENAPFPTLTRAECVALAPDVDDEPLQYGLGWVFIRLIDEAREDGLELVGSSYEYSHLLGAVFNGAALIGHGDETDYKQLFRRHARRCLGLLGVEGQRDPRAPRIPRKYRKKGGRR